MSCEMVDLDDFVELATPVFKPESGGDSFVMIDLAKPVFMPVFKPGSGRFVFVDRVWALCLPSGAGLCTSGRVWHQSVASVIDAPALRFRDTSPVDLARPVFKPENGGDSFVMIDLAKPESGRLLFWDRVGAFRPPSGAGFCTSERAECLCAAYTIDAPALRFRRTSFLSLPHDVLSGMSLSPL